jgi:hypothetical protein
MAGRGGVPNVRSLGDPGVDGLEGRLCRVSPPRDKHKGTLAQRVCGWTGADRSAEKERGSRSALDRGWGARRKRVRAAHHALQRLPKALGASGGVVRAFSAQMYLPHGHTPRRDRDVPGQCATTQPCASQGCVVCWATTTLCWSRAARGKKPSELQRYRAAARIT